jgi:hypothetical protein
MNPLATLISLQWQYGTVVFVLAAAAFGFAWSYYESVLKEPGPDRDRLLDRLGKGGGPRAFYIDQMTAMLNRIDAWLGDSGQARGWVARAFGLSSAPPCWTAQLFDTCAVLAVAYPVASLLVTWLLAGTAGPVGDLIGLPAEADWRVRLAAGVAAVFASIASSQSFLASKWPSRFWVASLGLAAGLAVDFAPSGAIVVLAVGFAVGLVVALATVGILGRGLGVGTISIAIAVAYAFITAGGSRASNHHALAIAAGGAVFFLVHL